MLITVLSRLRHFRKFHGNNNGGRGPTFLRRESGGGLMNKIRSLFCVTHTVINGSILVSGHRKPFVTLVVTVLMRS